MESFKWTKNVLKTHDYFLQLQWRKYQYFYMTSPDFRRWTQMCAEHLSHSDKRLPIHKWGQCININHVANVPTEYIDISGDFIEKVLIYINVHKLVSCD